MRLHTRALPCMRRKCFPRHPTPVAAYCHRRAPLLDHTLPLTDLWGLGLSFSLPSLGCPSWLGALITIHEACVSCMCSSASSTVALMCVCVFATSVGCAVSHLCCPFVWICVRAVVRCINVVAKACQLFWKGPACFFLSHGMPLVPLLAHCSRINLRVESSVFGGQHACGSQGALGTAVVGGHLPVPMSVRGCCAHCTVRTATEYEGGVWVLSTGLFWPLTLTP